MRRDLLAPAEEPGLWTPPDPAARVIPAEGFHLVARHEDARARRRAGAGASWAAQEASGRVEHHVALVDGRPAGFARLVATAAAGVLMGGSVAPWARGRGAYRALVHARFLAAAARGTPRLVTAAGAMSTPVLERLGFARIGEVRLLRDPLA